MTGEVFEAFKSKWQEQLLADHGIRKPAAFKVGIALSLFINRTTRTAFPSQLTLQKRTGLSLRMVQYGLEELRERGHLQMSVLRGRKPRGRHDRNEYRPLLKDAALNVQSVAHLEPIDATNCVPKAQPVAPEMRNGLRPTFLKDLSKDLSGSAIGFDRWISIYPKRVNIGAARRAYDVVIGAGLATHVELENGAALYGRQRAGQDPRYTKSPTRWLEDECWKDEAHSRSSETERRDPAQFTPADWLPILRRWQRSGEWTDTYWGPRPGESGCVVPTALLTEIGHRRAVGAR